MQDLAVAPGSLESAGAALHRAHDAGTTQLARAIVQDVIEGFGDPGLGVDIDGTLPRVVALLGEQSADIGRRLGTAAGAYRRADWLAHLAVESAR